MEFEEAQVEFEEALVEFEGAQVEFEEVQVSFLRPQSLSERFAATSCHNEHNKSTCKAIVGIKLRLTSYASNKNVMNIFFRNKKYAVKLV